MRWSAALVALAIAAAPDASPAQPLAPDLTRAARELARKTATFVGKGESVAAGWRDVSSLGSAALAQARAAFEAGLRDAGTRVGDAQSMVEAQITLSENQTEYLLVEEVRKGEERQVWMAAWNRSSTPASGFGIGVLLETRLLWEQPERILDVAVNGDVMLVLSGSSLMRLTRSGGQWTRESTPLPVKPWPRDLRGRLQWNGTVQVNLPGMTCNGTPETLQCRTGDDPWTLGPGRAPLLATFPPGRNYFDGRVVTPTGIRKTIPPFYSAAAAEDGGRAIWLLAMVDGSTQIFDASLDPLGSAGAWGSDLAGTEVSCGGRPVVLATRPDDREGPDTVRAFALVNRAVVPMGSPAEFPGPVTALWPAANGATAIVRNGATGQYQAYAVTVACGQ